MNKNLIARLALTALVCGASFYVSFRHITEVAVEAGNTWDVAMFFPVTIDAVILVSAFTLMATTGVNRTAKSWATAGRVFGFAATTYCNIAASHFSSVNSAVINMLPALALIVTVELLVYGVKSTPAARASQTRARKATAAKKAAPKAETTKLHAV